MGRPSIKAERTAEILDAYEQCVARFGIDGATLERVAKQAGLARALIRHNVGNRDDLFDALVERFFDVSEQRIRDLIDALPDSGRARALVDVLFDIRHSNDTHVLVAEALIAAAADRPALAGRMKDWVADFVAAIASVLQAGLSGRRARQGLGGGDGRDGHLFQRRFADDAWRHGRTEACIQGRGAHASRLADRRLTDA